MSDLQNTLSDRVLVMIDDLTQASNQMKNDALSQNQLVQSQSRVIEQ